MLGSSVGPRGIAQESSTPSCSSRKSKCIRVAWCFCTQNRLPSGRLSQSDVLVARRGSPLGSGVCVKSRFRRYSSRAMHEM